MKYHRGKICPKCGGEREFRRNGAKQMRWSCAPCNKAYNTQYRKACDSHDRGKWQHSKGIKSGAYAAGANESLRLFLERNWTEPVISRLATLLSSW